MNHQLARIIALSICLHAGYIYNMDSSEANISQEMSFHVDFVNASDTDTIQEISIDDQFKIKILQDMQLIEKNSQNKQEFITISDESTESVDHEQLRLQAQIRKRKLCNMIYGVATLTMMGVDIFNSFFDEEGLFTQWSYIKYSGGKYTDCKCPNRALTCEVKDKYDNKVTCEPTTDSYALYTINDSTTVWRIYAGSLTLYHLYQVQKALNTQSIDEDDYNEKNISHNWSITHGVNAGALGTIASIAGIVNGFANYPRTICVWGLNAALDVAGALNWNANKQACEAIIAQNKEK